MWYRENILGSEEKRLLVRTTIPSFEKGER
jgi:hypothetical protein